MKASSRRPMTGVSGEQLRDWYTQMRRIRRFEEYAIECFREGKIYGVLHPYIGQEAIAVGVMAALMPTDRILSTHRGHGHLLAKGADLMKSFAELFGRADGYCRGLGGSMHIAAVDKGMLGANGIVAAGAGIANGSAFQAKTSRSGVVTVAFFGDGATGQGLLWEAMLLSATWKLPIVWVCENNAIASATDIRDALPSVRVGDLVTETVMPSTEVDGNDVVLVYEAAQRAVNRAREGEGPSLIEARSFRQYPHVMTSSGFKEDDRDPELRATWRARDPLAVIVQEILERNPDDRALLEGIDNSIDTEIEIAIEAAERSPILSLEDMTNIVFATEPGRSG